MRIARLVETRDWRTYVWFSPLGEKKYARAQAMTTNMRPITKLALETVDNQLWAFERQCGELISCGLRYSPICHIDVASPDFEYRVMFTFKPLRNLYCLQVRLIVRQTTRAIGRKPFGALLHRKAIDKQDCYSRHTYCDKACLFY